ncbi:hypothetical protein LRP88_09324 [Fusarium phalaenopsidis]
MKHLLSISLFIRATFAMANAASKCLYNPIEFVAGLDLVTMRTAYPLSEPCTATIDFDDQDFLPITYTFKPIPCDGPELAQFSVPLNAPSGEAYITWLDILYLDDYHQASYEAKKRPNWHPGWHGDQRCICYGKHRYCNG